MLSRRRLPAVFALLIAVLAPVAAKGMERRSFDAKAFQAVQAAGRTILIEVSAPWCPVCKAQKPILARLATSPKFKDVIHFEIDFDSQKDLLRRFKVQKQSTLITFKGTQEVARSTGDTNVAAIESLLDLSI